jgi:osmotically inducible lipoprotein OsmB
MNSKHADTASASRISRAAIITFASAFALITMTGCFGSPRATDTFAGAAIGAGGGALIGGAEGSPGAGALIGGLGGGAIGYIVGTETENNRYYGGGYGPYRGYYPGGY